MAARYAKTGGFSFSKMLDGPERRTTHIMKRLCRKQRTKPTPDCCPDCGGSGKERVAITDRLRAGVILLECDIPDVHLRKVASVLANIARDTLQCGVCDGV